MEILVKIKLDDTWNEYHDTDPKLFMEDLFPPEKRMDGVESVELVGEIVDKHKDVITMESKMINIFDSLIT